MALNGNQIPFNTPTATPSTGVPLRRAFLIPSWQWSSPKSHKLIIVSASKKLSSSRTGKFDSKNKRSSSVSTKEEKEKEKEKEEAEKEPIIKDIDPKDEIYVSSATGIVDDGFVLPKLPGEEPDFWEGPQWDAFGFFIQYLWAFGLVFALIACGIAVVTFNEGATDFKDTPVYKESIQSREFLEEPESSKADVFESNPTEEAPNLE